MKKAKTNVRDNNLSVHGLVQWDDNHAPLKGASVLIYDLNGGRLIGQSKTDTKGYYHLRKAAPCVPSYIYALVIGQHKKIVASSQDTPVHVLSPNVELNINVSAASREGDPHQGPTIKVGPFKLNAVAAKNAKSDVVLDIAKLMIGRKVDSNRIKRLKELSPEIIPSNYLNKTLCGTAILRLIDELIKLHKWPRELGLEVDHILSDYGYTSATYNCGNFSINYYIDGPAAVPADTSTQDVVDPGTTTVLTTLTTDNVTPTYIRRICFWLNFALNRYINSPFNLKNPASGGAIPVVVNTAPFGSASPSGTFYLNNSLPNDLIAAVTVHELFHMVQFQYATTGPDWFESMLEGGAVWAEDTNTSMLNRYVDEAKTNFNGTGVQTQPQLSLESAVYKCSLFWRYLSEQASSLVNDGQLLPLGIDNVGVDVYKPLIEACSAGSWSTSDLRGAINSLPWYRDFYAFGYLDPATLLELSNGETVLGNYALACYIKDLANVPDRRFTFMENDETVYIDEVLAGIPGITETALPNDTLIPVTIASSGNLTSGSNASFNGNLPGTFCSQYFSTAVDPSVTSIHLSLNSPMASMLFQLVLVDQDGNVREIYRTDKNNYVKQFPNNIGGKVLSKVVVIITAATSTGGNFSIALNAVSAASDVMVTRWNTVLKREYEFDPKNWSWNWVSPDIWVDNDGDGIADGVVYFNYNNQLFVRLHNKGNADASNISVAFFYQDASGGLNPNAWLPVQGTNGVTQSLSGLSLAAGLDNQWSVNWSPVPSGNSSHFCVKVVVTVPGDPNADNKRAQSNFGNVQVKGGGFADLSIVRRNIEDLPQAIELTVIPRLTKDFQIAQRDIDQNGPLLLNPGETSVDTLRILNRPVKDVRREQPKEDKTARKGNCCCCPPMARRKPDVRGHYPTNPAALPPGVAGKPLVTLVHTVNGRALGGVTFMISHPSKTKK